MRVILLTILIGLVASFGGGASVMWGLENMLSQWNIAGPGYWHCFWFVFFLIGLVGVIRSANELTDKI